MCSVVSYSTSHGADISFITGDVKPPMLLFSVVLVGLSLYNPTTIIETAEYAMQIIVLLISCRAVFN